MDRVSLVKWLERGLSLGQIGAIVDRHPSTVAYWLTKHGLVANGHQRHSARGGIPRDELEALVRTGDTLVAIAERFGVSTTTIRHRIKRYGLPRPHAVRRNDVTSALEQGRRTLLRECGQHGWTVYVIESSGRARCRKCRMERVAQWRRRAKARLVEEAGGKCKACGYDRCPAALHFHHLEPAEKAFALSLRGVTRSMKALRAEAAKCVLLCANCHAEVEVGALEI